ncbi:DUF3793 family protein [Dehalobacter sp. DCM]|uniref:DUF3793 family protein n=1 Tax=Dehalobacter sp. DCM TaxID=2907827 RepID=UPI0030818906|nr:DUF3793 family protein [Dehalobacter sp. DCM]
MNEHLLSYLTHRHTLSTRDYLLDLIMFHLMPLLWSSKSAELMTFTGGVRKDLPEIWDRIKTAFFPLVSGPITIDYVELYRDNKQITVFFYNAFRLDKIMSDHANRNFLIQYGYNPDESWSSNLDILKARFRHPPFPHEVGLFLGIPLHDVRMFIECPGAKPILKGYWKVYQSQENAKELFDAYTRARDIFIQYVIAGNSVADFYIKARQAL